MQFFLHLCIYKPQKRIDAYLSKIYPERSRSFFQHIIECGSISVNDKKISKASMELRKGDLLKIDHELPDKPWHIEARTDIHLDILYEDTDTLVINKPLGLTVHPGDDSKSKHESVAHALLGLPNTNFSIKNSVRPGIVHRLDKWTSGVLLAAKNDSAVEFYSTQFKDRSVKKEYLALVYGSVQQTHGFIEAPIGRSLRDRKKMEVVSGGKAAKTEFFVLDISKEYTLLRIILHTGRTHQIRVHFASIGHPLVGDSTYSQRKNPFPILQGQFLHAWRLTFHTLSHRKQTISAPLPKEFSDILHTLHFDNLL